MPTALANPPAPTAAASQLWQELTRFFREACILRRQGKHTAAAAILEKKLPPVIRAWAMESRLTSVAAKTRLQEFFTEEQARVESSWLISQFVAPAVATPVIAPTIPTGAVARRQAWYPPITPRRIPIDDVVGMLDMVRENERLAVA